MEQEEALGLGWSAWVPGTPWALQDPYKGQVTTSEMWVQQQPGHTHSLWHPAL